MAEFSLIGAQRIQMPDFPRHIQPLIEEVLGEFRILYLTGPRQAGKTTLALSVADQLGMDYVTLDDQNILASAENDPQAFVRSFEGSRVVLDEFQYAPALVPAIKAVSDSLPSSVKGKFLLTGSADIFRSTRTQEALPGHMARVELYPLSVSEILKTTNAVNIIDLLLSDQLDRSVTSSINSRQLADTVVAGGYPEIQSKSQRAKRIWYNSYVEGRLFKDFESLHAARGDYHSKVQALSSRLAGLCGTLLKYSSVGNDLDLDDKVVKTYVEILELMFIIKRLPAYVRNQSKRLTTRMPKLHFIDTGLACHLLGIHDGENLVRTQFYGGMLENFVFMELMKQTTWAEKDVAIYHYRDKRKNEVDLVLEEADGVVTGIEVKSASSIGERDFRGLLKLAEAVPRQFRQGIVFYGGDRMLPFDRNGFRMKAVPIGLMVRYGNLH